MNVTAFNEGKKAYKAGNFQTALEYFTACTVDQEGMSPADLGKLEHLIGNCHIKNNEPIQAAIAYRKALATSNDTHKPSLYVNLGTALLGSREYEQATEAFRKALHFEDYKTPYKAYSGLGTAQLRVGNVTEAGAAFREAALDEKNPAPAKALVNLGVCFMELSRPEDAALSYEAALEFDLASNVRGKAKANLGQAYMAMGRVNEAIAAFEDAEACEGYRLSAMAAHDFDIACSLQKVLNKPEVYDPFDPQTRPENSPETTGVFDYVAGEVPMAESPTGQVPLGGYWPKTGEMPAVGEGDEATAPEQASEYAEEEPEEQTMPEEEALSEPEREASEAEELQAEPAAEEEAPEADAVTSPAGVTLAIPAIEDEEPEQGNDDDRRPGDVADPFAPLSGGEGAFASADAHEDEESNLPSPEDSAFFDISETEIVEGAKQEVRKKRKRHGAGLKVAIVIAILLVLMAGAAVAAYVLGYGYPLQEDTVDDFFNAVKSDTDTSPYWSSSVDEATRTSQLASVEGVTSHDVTAVQRSMSQSEVFVSATLNEGGTVNYELVMSRNGIGWQIEYIELDFPGSQE